MPEVLIRPYRPADARPVADLMNDMERAAGAHPGFVPEDIVAIVDNLIVDVDRDTRLVCEPDGTLTAVGLVTTPPAGGHRIELWGGVHPDRVGRGTGRDLLDWQIRRATAIHGAVAPDADWLAECGSNVDDAARVRLLERFGLSAVRYFLEMTADTGPQPVAVPDGLRFETCRPELERAVYAAHVEAFRDHWGYQERPFEMWIGLTMRSEAFRADLSRVALAGDEVVGYVLTYTDADPQRVYVGHVGTRRSWRRRGVAAGLLGEVLSAAHAVGIRAAGLGVDSDSPTGAVGVYERLGFKVESRLVTYHLPLRGPDGAAAG